MLRTFRAPAILGILATRPAPFARMALLLVFLACDMSGPGGKQACRLSCRIFLFLRKADCSAPSALPQSSEYSQPALLPSVARLYCSYSLPAICQDRSASKLAACPDAYSFFYGKRIAPHLRRSRNPRNTHNPPCSLRSHGFIARIPCLRYVRTGWQASLPPVLPHTPLSTESGLLRTFGAPAILGILATRPAPFARMALLLVFLACDMSGQVASKLATCPAASQGFPVTLYQSSRIIAIFLGLVIQI